MTPKIYSANDVSCSIGGVPLEPAAGVSISIEMSAAEEVRIFQEGCERIAEAVRAAAIVADVHGQGGLAAYLQRMAAELEDPQSIVRLPWVFKPLSGVPKKGDLPNR